MAKALISLEGWDPSVPWRLYVPPCWGRPEDVCDGYDPAEDGPDHVPGSWGCDHPFLGLYGDTFWESHARAVSVLDELLRQLDR